MFQLYYYVLLGFFMRLAFALYKYFPYGGLARDFMRIANVCLKKGYTVDVYVMEWHGDLIAGCDTHVLNCSGWTNHAKVNHFHQQLSNQIKNEKYDVVIGFNKIPNLDVYYAADPCYVDKFAEKNFLHKLNPRYRFYAGVEESVFGIESKTVCLMISDIQAELFKKYYQIPNDHLVKLPPGIDPNRRRPIDADEKRLRFRHELLLEKQDLLVLMVGTGFKTKGVDRAMMALAELPKELLGRTKLMVVGEDDIAAYERLANQIGVTENVRFMGGRPDVPAFLLAADLLLHPARKDNTGTVILEAMVAGLPMLVSEVCGYAKHVVNSNAGKVISAPFSQKKLNQLLVEMLSSNDKLKWSKSGLAYADTEDLYSMPEKAVAAIERVARDKKNVD